MSSFQLRYVVDPRIAAVTLAAALIAQPYPARGDWPQPRGNPQRTAAASGTSNLEQPVPYWRHYLGGTIGPRGAIFLDVDGDSFGEVVFVSGGKLAAKERGNALVWETPVLGIAEIVAVSDLDGDSAREIVVRSNKQVFFIEPSTGRILWEEPADDFGWLGGVRVADLDGDRIDDLLVQECGCCRINNGATGFMYRFAAGFAAGAAQQKAWTMGSVRCGGNKSMTVLDMNGDGRAEVTESWSDGLAVVSGETGEPIAPVLSMGPRSSESSCVPADVDGDGGQELVCLQNNGPQNDAVASRRLYVIGYEPGTATQEAHLAVRWQKTVGEVPRRVVLGAYPVSDLDGDGLLEIVASGVLADDRWITEIFDARDGSRLATIVDARIVGVARLGAKPLILTTRDDALDAWSFGRQTGAAEPVWSLPGRRPLLEPDWQAAALTSVATRIAALDLTGDGTAELLTASTDGPSQLVAYDVSGGVPEEAAAFWLGESAVVLAAWVTPEQPLEPPRVLLAPSDGVMRLLDHDFGALAPALRFGGYYPRGEWRILDSTPVVADLGLGADSVVVSDSRGALLRIDARDASLAVPPRVAWTRLDTSAPLIVPGMDGDAPGIVCREELADGNHGVAVLDAAGNTLRAVDVGGQLLSDIVPAELDGDGVSDLIIEWGEPGNLELRHRAYAGATLEPLWDTTPQFKGTTRFPAGGAILDWNGDGTGDFVHQYYQTQVISGADGAILAESAQSGFYFMPIVLGQGQDTRLVLHAGFDPITILDTSLAPVWSSSDDDRPYPYGAIATCPDGVPRLVEGSLLHPSRLKLTQLAGPSLGTYETLVLAGGQRFPDEAGAEAAGLFLGQLTSASVHENLQGDGRPTALVGSEDGWLYAVDACTGALAFTVPFGASVGAVAFGDTDGDGNDEVLVAVGDGYLYALEQPPVRAPAWVIDIDPDRGGNGVDVDVIHSSTRVSAVWEAVEGADGYEVAVVHEATGQVVSPWQPVGAVTQVTINSVSLAQDERYIVAVRALADDKPSPDALSDGVMVDIFAGYPTGCACRAGGGIDPGALALMLLVICGVLARRRRAARE